MSLSRPLTLKSRAWSSTSLDTGAEHVSAMSGLARSMTREQLLKKLEVMRTIVTGYYPKQICPQEAERKLRSIKKEAGNRGCVHGSMQALLETTRSGVKSTCYVFWRGRACM